LDYICYFDEAGCPGPLASAAHDLQPVLVITGIIVRQADAIPLTRDFLNIKRKYFPKKLSNAKHDLDHILIEIKGAADLRSHIRKNGAKAKAQLKFADDILATLKQYDVKIFSRIWIKGPGKQFSGRSVYTRTVQELCRAYSHFLDGQQATGVLIGDFRNPRLNSTIAHTIFTRKMKATGDEFPRILELPTFAHSENHAALQIADVVSSAMLYPMALDKFCRGHINSGHVNNNDAMIAHRFSKRIKNLQFRYSLKNKRIFSISVNDGILSPKRTAWTLFS
jgi:hypothetical protein